MTAKKKTAKKHGGKRPGAGRKPGVRNKRTRKMLDIVAASGLTPLDCMLTAMRGLAEEKRWVEAADIARAAAPYVHPKLSAIEHTGKDGKDLHPRKLEIVFID